MFRTPSYREKARMAGILPGERVIEVNKRYRSAETDEEREKILQEVCEEEERQRISKGYKTVTPETPPSAHEVAPGPWTNTRPNRVLEVEHTPPSPTTPISTRQHQAKKKGVTLRFSPPPPPTTTKKLPTIFERSKITKVSPSRTYTKHTPPNESKDAAEQRQRMADAKTSYDKANEHLSNSRNLKTEIKQGVQGAIDRLYALIKEMDRGMTRMKNAGGIEPGEQGREKKETETQTEQGPTERTVQNGNTDFEKEKVDLVKRMEEHASLMRENLERMNNFSQVIQKHSVDMSEASTTRPSYVSVAATKLGGNPPAYKTYRTLHSVAITSGLNDADQTTTQTIEEIGKVLDPKDGGLEVERIRKARDGRWIISCKTEEDRQNVKRKLAEKRPDITTENLTNKRPLVMISGVLRKHTDEDILRALRNQNRAIFEGQEDADKPIEIAYKIRGKNILTHKVVCRVTPTLWKRLTEVGTVRIDLRTLPVVDRSPLVQCTLCLGFGHGKRMCQEALEAKCSHCGGSHTIRECPEYAGGAPPKCSNCTREARNDVAHNSFSENCPVRKRWEWIARSTVAYS